MESEVGNEGVTIDPVVMEDVVITVDPIVSEPIVIAEPLPVEGTADLPPGAQTFGGPIDPAWYRPLIETDGTDGTTDSSADGTGGTTDASGDGKPDGGISSEDFVAIYDKEPVPISGDGTPPLVYTMSGGDSGGDPAGDPIVYATADGPSRSSHVPLPYERGAHDAPSAPAHDIDPDVAAIKYAAADTSYSGLDLL